MKLFRLHLLSLLVMLVTVVHSQVVEWADITGANLQGNQLVKNSSNGWSNSGANSYNILTANHDGWVQMPVVSTSNKVAFGLTSIYVAPDYRTFDFAFLVNNKVLFVYERGILKAQVGKVSVNDMLRIERSGTTVLYKKNGVVLLKSTPPTTDPIRAAAFSADLVAAASLFNNGAIISDVTCSFPNKFRVDAQINPYVADSALGSINLTIGKAPSPYIFIWQGVIYPSRTQFKRFVDSAATVGGLIADTNLYHVPDSLRALQSETGLKSGVYPVAAVDSLNDTLSINADVTANEGWINTSGLAISTSSIPRFVSGIPGDSALDPVYGGVPNISQPVVTFSPTVNDNILAKTDVSGWSTGMATSIDVFRADQFSEVSFVVPNSNTLLSAGIKPDSIPNQTGYSDILFGYYFDNGSLSLIINGTLSAMGQYSAGDRFSIQNRYDADKHLERIVYRQNGYLLKIVYVLIKNGAPDPPNVIVMNSAPVYAFKAALSTNTAVLQNLNFLNYYYLPYPFVDITPASCGFPGSAIISANVMLSHNYAPPIIYWTSGANTYNSALVNNAPIGVYYLHIKEGPLGGPYVIYTYGPYFVGYKVYWGGLNNAAALAGHPNSITESPYPSSNSGGWSSNAISPTANQNSFVAFQVDPSINGEVACGFSAIHTPVSNFGLSNITYGILAYPLGINCHMRVYPYLSSCVLNGNLGIGVINGIITPHVLLGISPINNPITYATQYSYTNVSNPNHYAYVTFTSTYGNLINYSTGPYQVTANSSAVHTVQAFLESSWFTPLANPILYNGICSFPCISYPTVYATLTKQLDGTYYLSPYGRLSFKYDEEYVNNGDPLPFTIFDRNHNVVGSGLLTPDNYKDNYYTIDLTTVNTAIGNDYYILQITNKKGEITELRFKD